MSKWIAVLATLLPACAIESTDDANCIDGKCDGTNGGTCTDARYGDGTCNTDLDCATPDIDCFTTFENDALASDWFKGLEKQLATQQGRAERPILPQSDPRYPKLRDLVDRGWAAFKATRPVGDLAMFRPGIVLLDDPTVNAFAGSDGGGKSSLAVIVQTGALATGLPDEDVLAVIMHELQHSVGLHFLPDVKNKLYRYYIAKGSEPIGRVQPNDPDVQKFASEWLAAGSEVGQFSTASLGGFPRTSSALGRVLATVLAAANQANPTACTRTLALQSQLMVTIGASVNRVTGELGGDPTKLLAASTEMMRAAQTECTASMTVDLISVLATMANLSPAVVEMQTSPSDLLLIKNKNPIEGISNLVVDRRTKMRGIESSFAQRFGVPWTQLRYFTEEEDADDVSVTVMRKADFEPAAEGDFLLRGLMSAADALACSQVLDGGNVPHYGVDLTDTHHATCWRVHHIHAFGDWLTNKRSERMPDSAPVISAYRLPVPPPPPNVLME